MSNPHQDERLQNEDQEAKDREFALKLQLQMNGDNHHLEVEAGKLSDAFKDPANAPG